MELTSQVLREVEFGSELRGYKTSEVDDFLEEVAVALDEMSERLRTLEQRVERAETASREREVFDDEESIRRTLVLAQRTADLAIKEAQEEAAQLLDGARADAETIVADARVAAERIIEDTDRALRDEASRLIEQRDRASAELDALDLLLSAERERLTESLTAMLHFVDRNLAPRDEVTAVSSEEPAESPQLETPEVEAEADETEAIEADGDEPGLEELDEPEVDELEAAIAEDAAAAAPSASSRASEIDEASDGEESPSRPQLKAVPPIEEEDNGPDTTPTPEWDFGSGSPAS